MDPQRTLERSLSCAGIGLHSGHKVSLTLKPAPADTGIRFRRADLGGVEIPAHVSHVCAISLRDAVSARRGAHRDGRAPAVGARRARGIDNAIVELNTPEVPIMDGSAAPFIYLIREEAGMQAAGRAPQVPEDHAPGLADAWATSSIALYPRTAQDHLLDRVRSPAAAPPGPGDGDDRGSFVDEIAPARTFAFLKEVEMLRQQGLALGGSLDNAIVIGETGVLNNTLRFEDEFVRHKILDAIGDLALGRPPGDRATSWRTAAATRCTRRWRRSFSRNPTRGSWSRIRPRCRWPSERCPLPSPARDGQPRSGRARAGRALFHRTGRFRS